MSDKTKTITGLSISNSFPNVLHHPPAHSSMTKNPPFDCGGFAAIQAEISGRLFLPCTLLMTVRFEALAAFVFRHLQTSFLLKISHGVKRLMKGQRATGPAWCKA
jgi:hypothetical protein